jgi:hypothetical protein
VVPFLASTFGIFLLRHSSARFRTSCTTRPRSTGPAPRFLSRWVVPISRASIVTIVLFTFLSAWNALDWPILVYPVGGLAADLVRFCTPSSRTHVELHLMQPGGDRAAACWSFFFTQKQFTGHRHDPASRLGWPVSSRCVE